MSRPKTKTELISAGEEGYKKLWELIDSLSPEEQRASFKFGAEAGKEAHWGRDKNIRDVLVHLYEWHDMFLDWVRVNSSGEATRQFLLDGYNWKNYGEMNQSLWRKHQSTTYEQAKELVDGTHAKVVQVLGRFTDTELFEKEHYDWVGGSSLGQYAISTTVGHYDWAIKKIKMHIKTLK
ncbi:MAG: ClbS/DfsB family four-helix bundle protein [Candidatus Saccharimonadales bacterium]